MILADSSPRWLPLVLVPVALVVWVIVLGLLFRAASWAERLLGIDTNRSPVAQSSPPADRPSRPASPAGASGPHPPVAASAEVPRRPPTRDELPTWDTPVNRAHHDDWPDREKHLYSAGGVNRGNVVAFVGLVLGVPAAVGVLRIPHLSAGLAAVLGAVAGSIFSLGLVWVFETYAWRWPHASFHFSKVPDVSGEWIGAIEVSEGQEGEPTKEGLPCRVRIKQNWSRVQIDFITHRTESWSLMATLDAKRLHYEYYVAERDKPESRPGDPIKNVLVKPHDGMARLTPSPKPGRGKRGLTLNGCWFNDHRSFGEDQDLLRWGDIDLWWVG